MKTVAYQEYAYELKRARAQLEENTCSKGISRRICIVNVGSDDKIEMGVTVAGTGDVPSIKHFAHCIEEAANIAEKFKYNGYTVKKEELIMAKKSLFNRARDTAGGVLESWLVARMVTVGRELTDEETVQALRYIIDMASHAGWEPEYERDVVKACRCLMDMEG